MTHSHFSQFYTPRHKKDLLAALLPTWAGNRTDLRQMSRSRLVAIFRSMRQRQIQELIKK